MLRTIYLCRTEDIIETCYKVLGNLTYYKGSMWRIANFYAVSSYILSENHNEQIQDILNAVDMIVPYGDIEVRNNVGNALILIDEMVKSGEDPDMFRILDMYINAYLGCGKYLLPCLVDI